MVLFFVACATTLVFSYLVNNIILKIYAEKVSFKRRLLFIIICGLVLNNFWTYGVYFLGGKMSFPAVVYTLVTVPNPFFGIVFYYCGVKVLRLSPFRSLNIMYEAYIYFIAIKIFNRFIGFTFFAQTGPQYNYLLDAASLCCCAVINVGIYYLTLRVIDRFHLIVKQADQLSVTALPREIFYTFLKNCFVYGLVTIVPMLIPGNYIYLLLSYVLTMILQNVVLSDARKGAQIETDNKETYINNLVESIDRLRGVKHDINNMLVTYEGYIEVGDLENLKQHHMSLIKITAQANYRMDLAKRIKENPALVSLINAKLDDAEGQGVIMDVEIACGLDFDIDNMDLCRSLGCLLDNAVEAAADSSQRKVLLSIEKRPDHTKLIILKNSTRADVDIGRLAQGKTTKAGHSGMGLAQLRKTLRKYSNCSFQLSCFDHSFTAYLAVTPKGARSQGEALMQGG